MLTKYTRDQFAADALERSAKSFRGLAGGRKGGVNVAERTISGSASTIWVDRDGEVILPAAYEATIPQFMGSNAPMLSQHTHRSDDAMPTQAGWVVRMAVSNYDVPCDFRFAKTDLGEQWWLLASDPAGNGVAFSVGFMPVAWLYGTCGELAKEMPELREVFARAGLKDTDTCRVYTQIELYEVSLVGVPSNRQSVQQLEAKSAAALTGEQLEAHVKAIAEAVGEAVSAALSDERVAACIRAAVKEELAEGVAELRDSASEVIEAMLQARDTLGMGGPADPDAGDDPPPEPAPEKEAGESALAAEARKLQEAAGG